MKSILFLLTCWPLTAPDHAPPEDMIIYTLVELCVQSESVYEAKCIRYEEGVYTFCGHPLGARSLFTDTFSIADINHGYELPGPAKSKYGAHFLDADLVMLFGALHTDGNFKTTHTGYRLLRDSLVFVPEAPWDWGKVKFHAAADSISWSRLVLNTKNIRSRINQLKQLRRIPNAGKRNKALLNWLEFNKHTFNLSWELNKDQGWGSIEWDIYTWITDGQIAEDTWKASRLYHEIECGNEPTWPHCRCNLKVDGGGSFQTVPKIDWLIRKLLDQKTALVERHQAADFLLGAIDRFARSNKTDKSTGQLHRWKQKMLEVSTHPELGEPASRVLARIDDYL